MMKFFTQSPCSEEVKSVAQSCTIIVPPPPSTLAWSMRLLSNLRWRMIPPLIVPLVHPYRQHSHHCLVHIPHLWEGSHQSQQVYIYPPQPGKIDWSPVAAGQPLLFGRQRSRVNRRQLRRRTWTTTTMLLMCMLGAAVTVVMLLASLVRIWPLDALHVIYLHLCTGQRELSR